MTLGELHDALKALRDLERKIKALTDRPSRHGGDSWEAKDLLDLYEERAELRKQKLDRN